MKLTFSKLAGAGNDFIVFDNRASKISALPKLAQKLCDRKNGIGGDGLITLERSKKADIRMLIINPDGSEAEMCGNGTRCVARFVHNLPGRKSDKLSIETLAGILEARVNGASITVRMTEPKELRPGMRVRLGGKWLCSRPAAIC